MEEEEIDSVYLHVGDGGTTIAVVDYGYGPAIRMSHTHYGQPVSRNEILTTRRALKELADMFLEASKHEGWSENYCYAAKSKADRPTMTNTFVEAGTGEQNTKEKE